MALLMDRDGPRLETLLYSRKRPTGLDRALLMHGVRVPGFRRHPFSNT
jgi:hypothetical protein